MKQTVLFIDAGHGGFDDATKTYHTYPQDGKNTLHTNGKPYHNNGWFYEGKFNRQIALEFIEAATKERFMCVPVFRPMQDSPRTGETGRCEIANTVWEKLGKPNALLLSFHANSNTIGTTPQNGAAGACAFVYRLGSNTATLAEKIMIGVQGVFDMYGSSRRAQLVHDKPLDMTTYTKMPAILLEIGFFDNPQNADLLISKDFRLQVVNAILEPLKVLK